MGGFSGAHSAPLLAIVNCQLSIINCCKSAAQPHHNYSLFTIHY